MIGVALLTQAGLPPEAMRRLLEKLADADAVHRRALRARAAALVR